MLPDGKSCGQSRSKSRASIDHTKRWRCFEPPHVETDCYIFKPRGHPPHSKHHGIARTAMRRIDKCDKLKRLSTNGVLEDRPAKPRNSERVIFDVHTESRTAASPAQTGSKPEELRKISAYWRACNYLCAGMIYLRANPLLREPLRPEHFKNRLLGHWGSDPGQTFIWVHLNRVIRKYDLDMIYVSGPGHGAPAVLANCYLEGTYSEIYPEKSQDEAGMLNLFRAFSFPGQLGSHCTPEVPGSIHEGGELGYSVSHAFGAALIIRV